MSRRSEVYASLLQTTPFSADATIVIAGGHQTIAELEEGHSCCWASLSVIAT